MDEQLTESIGFVRELVGAAGSHQAFEERESNKRAALDDMFGQLTPELKQQIRDGLDVRVAKQGRLRSALKSLPLVGDSKLVNRVGSKELEDTEADLADGYGLEDEDAKRAHNALQQLLKLTKQALDRKDQLGNPLFNSPDEIEAEVFTPLVRQGVLPDNFVIGKYSEVQKLLDATFAGYKQRLQDVHELEQSESAKAKANAVGAGSKIDTFAGKWGRFTEKIDRALDMIATEDERRQVMLALDVAAVGMSAVFLVANIARWVPDENGDIRAVDMADRRLNPEDYLDTLSEERLAELGNDPDPDDISIALAQERRNDRLEAFLAEVVASLKLSGVSAEDIRNVVNAMTAAIEARESEPGRFTEEGILTTIDAAKLAAKSVKLVIDEAKVRINLGNCEKVSSRVAATREGLKRANGAMLRALKPYGTMVVTALENSLLQHIDSAQLVTVMSVSGHPDAEAAVQVFASALERAIGGSAPRDMASVQSVFEQGGKSVAAAFSAAVNVKQLSVILSEHPEEIPELLRSAVEAAIANGVTKELADLWRDPAVARGMLGKSVVVDDEAALQEVERAQAETAEFERQLVLIDEVGELAADRKAIDKLINQAKQSRILLEFVAGTAPILAGIASGAVNLTAVAAETVTLGMAGSIVGPIKAAKLIVQLAVQIAEAAKRVTLLKQFISGARAAKQAESPLHAAIAGLRSSKVDQVAYHVIDDALTAVQVATNIVGAIPNEYAMAIGITTSMVAATTQKAVHVANDVYDEFKLQKAWKVTRAALDAPSNRQLGLQALKLNSTLAVHALAWAGFEKQPVDPIARMMLKKLNLTEQSLAASGTEAKVRTYLETILYEDRQLLDPSKVVTDWALKSVTLTARDWFLTVSRATKVAVPKLNAGTDQAVVAALKDTDRQDLESLRQQTQDVAEQATEVRRLTKEAEDSGVQNEQLQGRTMAVAAQAAALREKIKRHREQGAALGEALAKYVPRATDGAPHVEMQAQVAEFQKLAALRRNELREIEAMLDDAI